MKRRRTFKGEKGNRRVGHLIKRKKRQTGKQKAEKRGKDGRGKRKTI